MACAGYQPLFEKFRTRTHGELELCGKAASADRIVVRARATDFFTGIEHRWAASLLACSLFEPTPVEVDRRDRSARLTERLINLRLESERRLSAGMPIKSLVA